MASKKLRNLLSDPYKRVRVMLIVSTIDETIKKFNFSDDEKSLAVDLWNRGIVSCAQLDDMLIEEALDGIPSKHS